jgi:hypothetical protein
MIRNNVRVIWALLLVLVLSPAPGAWAGAPTDQFREGVDRVFKILRDPELARDAQTPPLGHHHLGVEESSTSARLPGVIGQLWDARTPPSGGGSPLHRLDPALVRLGWTYGAEDSLRGDTIDGDRAVVRTALLLNDGGQMPSLQDAPHRRPRHCTRPVEGVSLVADGAGQQGHSRRVLRALIAGSVESSASPAASPGGTPVLEVGTMLGRAAL